MIVRYLVRTKDHGLIVWPDSTLNLLAHVDADFGGIHGWEHQDNLDSAWFRFGHMITFANVPLVWKSQLILEICLSTPHAECVGSSMAAHVKMSFCDGKAAFGGCPLMVQW